MTKTYGIIYHDSSYITIDLPENDYTKLKEAMVMGREAAVLDIGILARLGDIRSVIEQREKVEPVPDSGEPYLDPESEEWLAEKREQDERSKG